MVKHLWLSALLLAVAPTSARAGDDAATIDFSKPNPPAALLDRAEQRGQSAAIVPVAGRDALRIAFAGWTEQHRWLEWRWTPEQKLADFDTADFAVRFVVEKPCPVHRVNLRLQDATGETFQYEQKVDWSAPGEYLVEYRVAPEGGARFQTWGGNQDKKLDFPVRFLGMSADFVKDGGPGAFAVASIECRSRRDAGRTLVEDTVAGSLIDPAEKPALDLYQGPARNQSFDFAATPAGVPAVHVAWKDAPTAYFELGAAPARPLPAFDRIEFEVNIHVGASPSAHRVALRLADRTNETFQFQAPVVPARTGPQTLRFSVDAANPAPQLTWGGNQDKKLDFPVRFQGLACDYPKGSTGGIFIESVTYKAVARQPLVEAIALRLDTGHPVYVLEPGKEGELGIEAVNTRNAPVTADVEWRLSDVNGRTLPSMKRKIDFAPLAAVRLETPPPPARGIWYAACRVADPDNPGDWTERTASFAYMEPAGETPGRAEGFLFGVCSHPHWRENRPFMEREALAMGLIGAKILREDITLNAIEPEKGRRDYTIVDRIVESYGRHGLELEAILGGMPKWSEAGDPAHPDFDIWRRHVAGVFARYRGKIRYWEMWNEPDLLGFARFGEEVYLELARITREELRRADPEAVLLSGGFAVTDAFAHGSKKPGFHKNVMKAAGDRFDLHAFHGHGAFPLFADMIDDDFLPMRRAMDMRLPWYANETAFTSANSTEKIQAATLFKKLLFAWSRGSVGYNWYNLRNKGDDPRDAESSYGLLTRDFHPKAAYVAFNTITTRLRGKTFVRQYPLADGFWAFEFAGPDGRVVGAWNERFSRGAGERQLLLTDARAAELVDLMGNRRPAARLGGAVVLPLERDPLFLALDGATRADPVGSPLAVPTPPPAVPGRSTPLTVKLSNPLDAPLEYSLRLVAPPGIRPAADTSRRTLPPGGADEFATDLAVAADFNADFARPGELVVEFALGPDGAYRDRLRVPLHPGRVLPAGFRAKPDFVLDRRDQVVSLYDADPHKVHMLWRSPEDLAAKVWLAADATALRVRVEATDDRHAQPMSGAETWQGDNVQIALELPGPSGTWEIGLTRRDDGKNETYAWRAPAGLDPKAAAERFRLSTERKGTTTRYEAELPWAALGVDPAALRRGFRFNLMVNDNDGEGRKGWIMIAPGMGSGLDTSRYPFLILE